MPETVTVRRNNISRMLCLDCGESFVLNQDHKCDESTFLRYQDYIHGLVAQAAIVGIAIGGAIGLLIFISVLHWMK